MRQTRLGSLIESGFNVVIGFAINYAANLVILPLFGFHVSLVDNFYIGLLYTVVSVARSYAVRRWFESRIQRAAARIAGEQ